MQITEMTDTKLGTPESHQDGGYRVYLYNSMIDIFLTLNFRLLQNKKYDYLKKNYSTNCISTRHTCVPCYIFMQM